jgi:P27 family predicted phage terminase small subunit
MAKMPTGNPRGGQVKPTALKILHGDFKTNPQRRNTREPKPSAQPVEPPEYLSAHGRRMWDMLAPDMIRSGVLTSWDVPMFAELCEAFVVARLARTRIVQEQLGQVTVQPGGTTPNSVWRSSLFAITAGASKFGLTPADRVRLSTPEAEEFDDLISGPR